VTEPTEVPVQTPAQPVRGARLLEAVAVMDRLRSPGGCPWDAEQTHASLLPYLLEEAYEAAQAIEDGDAAETQEELGDVLLQVLFHARLGEEADPAWDIDSVAGGLVDKLVERHPHVFGDATVADAAEVDARWEEIKAAQKGRTSVVDGVPLALPALALSAKLRRRAARCGVDDSAFDPGEGYGARLWSLAAAAAADGVDAEAELRATARRYREWLREQGR